MKKQAFIVFALLVLPVMVVHAAPATPSATAKVINKQIEDLKDRLATKVAELRQTQKKAVGGIVKTVSISTLTIETKTKDVKIELTDDIKIYQNIKGKRTKLTTNELTKDDNVVVFGDYDATLDLLKAKVIIIQSPLPRQIAGTVSAIDKNEYTLTINTHEGQTILIDIEKYTKTLGWDKENGIQKSGFSKIAVGDTLHISGTNTPKKENRMSADRILTMGNLAEAPSTSTPTSTNTPASSPSAMVTKVPTKKP